jgi:hypothetical protein
MPRNAAPLPFAGSESSRSRRFPIVEPVQLEVAEMGCRLRTHRRNVDRQDAYADLMRVAR